MAKPYRELQEKMSPERRAKNEARAQELLAEMPLQELRRALSLTQVQVAETLGMSQTAVSKVESQTDMYVSTLRRFLSAMGGELKVIASFAHGEVEITQFSSEDDEKEAA